MNTHTLKTILFAVMALLLVTACGGRDEPEPAFTPIPTFTPTPQGVQPAGEVAVAPPGEPAVQQAVETPIPLPTETPTPLPLPTDTPSPTDTPTPPPTETPTPLPTETPTPTATVTPTPTPDFPFRLEAREQFPSVVPGVDEVRVYLYVYNAESYALPGYSMSVRKDGRSLPVQARSTGGLPNETRPGPTPHTRFANLGAAFFESPAGTWEVQLIDPSRLPAGPAALFVIEEGSDQTELYVRYRQKE